MTTLIRSRMRSVILYSYLQTLIYCQGTSDMDERCIPREISLHPKSPVGLCLCVIKCIQWACFPFTSVCAYPCNWYLCIGFFGSISEKVRLLLSNCGDTTDPRDDQSCRIQIQVIACVWILPKFMLARGVCSSLTSQCSSSAPLS